MSYIDGFLLPIPTKNLDEYRRISRKAGKIWREHGALDYRECAGDDMSSPPMLSFTKTAKAKDGETVIFSWILYKSRKHRDQVNKKVMADPRLAKLIDPKAMPFDMKRMSYGGFKAIVEA